MVLARARVPLAAIAGIAVLAGAVALAHVARPAAPRAEGPPPAGAFRDGGAPRHDPGLDDVLGGELPRLVLAGAHLAGRGALPDAERVARLAQLRAHPAFAAHGPGLARAWADLVDALAPWLAVTPADDGWAGATAALRARAGALTSQLAAAGLGYHVEANLAPDLPRRRTGVFTYRVERVAFVRAGGRAVRVLEARRLDRTDAGVALLGLTAEELEDPVVLLDAIEAKVQAQVLPVLAGHPFPLGADDGWAGSARARAAARAAGAAIRRELLAALYTDVGDAERAAARCRALLAASVRHHEAQHRLDQDGALPHPAVLARRLGDAPRSPFALRVRYELSAYLSQLASDVWIPQLTLWNLARHGLRRHDRRSAEALVAVFAIEALAARLGVPRDGDLLQSGVIDRDRLAALATAIAGRSTAELRSAAAGAWRDLFGAPLVRLTD